MSIGTGRKLRVTLDTNILISALVYGGKPEKILRLVVSKKIQAVTATILLEELRDVINKKFPLFLKDLLLLEKLIKKRFKKVRPAKRVDVLRDKDDNRVLEAALEGNCQYIITGDKDLLELKSYKNILIVTPDEFLKLRQAN